MPSIRRSIAVVAVSLAIAACSSTGVSPSPVASGLPSAGPSAGPTVGAIDHKTGSTDVVLRIEQGGGFVPIDFLASQAPAFTLFGNGVVVFQRAVTAFPQPAANGARKGVAWRTAKLDEGQVQGLLQFALGPGGLGTARDAYVAGGIADAPSTVFTIRAGGLDKSVVVAALSEATQPGPDTVARSAFLQLAKRLQDFDASGTISSDDYQPDRYRGVLSAFDPQPGVVAAEWPWPSIAVTDFKEGASDGTGGSVLHHRTMTDAEVSSLNLTDIQGGVSGLTMKGPDGATYSFTLRPLLVDEKE